MSKIICVPFGLTSVRDEQRLRDVLKSFPNSDMKQGLREFLRSRQSDDYIVTCLPVWYVTRPDLLIIPKLLAFDELRESLRSHGSEDREHLLLLWSLLSRYESKANLTIEETCLPSLRRYVEFARSGNFDNLVKDFF